MIWKKSDSPEQFYIMTLSEVLTQSHNNYDFHLVKKEKQANPDQEKLTVNRICKMNCIL